MKLSVILACLNEENIITTQLNALANQDWSEPWEVIVSDNGSIDHTIEIVEEFKGRIPNLRIIDAPDRKGQAHALNMGAEAARGESLAFCDADDEVGHGWIAAIGNALSIYDFVASRTEITKLNPSWVKKSRKNFQGAGIQKFDYPPYLPHAGGGTLGVKKYLHEAVEGFDESIMYLHDTDYCWRIQKMGIKLHFIPDALIHVRFRNKLRDIYIQSKNYGEHTVLLYKKHRKLGMPKLSWKKRFIYFLGSIKSFLLIRDKGDLASFIWNAGWHIGRLKGYKKYNISILNM